MSDPILDLLAAPPNPSMSVDESVVYAGGRRRLRRRALRRTGFGVVGVVGAAAVAFAALGTGADRDALPVGPSPSASSFGRVSAELLDGRYAVEVVPGAPADQPNVIFYAIKDGKRQQLAGASASPGMVSMGTGSGAEGVMLGTAPARATGFLVVAHGATGRTVEDTQPLPGTDHQAFGVQFTNPQDAGRYLDTIWLDNNEVVRHANGDVIPSVLVPDTEERIFVARPLGQLMGMISGVGGSQIPIQQSGITVLDHGEKPDGGAWRWRSSALLPWGAKNVAFRWSPGAEGGAVTLLPLPDRSGTIATAAATSQVRLSGPALLEVTWTDEAGERHTDAVD